MTYAHLFWIAYAVGVVLAIGVTVRAVRTKNDGRLAIAAALWMVAACAMVYAGRSPQAARRLESHFAPYGYEPATMTAGDTVMIDTMATDTIAYAADLSETEIADKYLDANGNVIFSLDELTPQEKVSVVRQAQIRQSQK